MQNQKLLKLKPICYLYAGLPFYVKERLPFVRDLSDENLFTFSTGFTSLLFINSLSNISNAYLAYTIYIYKMV